MTELLDVAAFDFLACLGKQSIADFAEGILPEELREQALDIECHWVNEKGGPAKLTGGLTVQATVRPLGAALRHPVVTFPQIGRLDELESKTLTSSNA